MEAGVQELNAGHFLILATFLKEEAALIEEGESCGTSINK